MKRILIVDDESNVRLNYRVTLEVEGRDDRRCRASRKLFEAAIKLDDQNASAKLGLRRIFQSLHTVDIYPEDHFKKR
jgi:hypothetical protein